MEELRGRSKIFVGEPGGTEVLGQLLSRWALAPYLSTLCTLQYAMLRRWKLYGNNLSRLLVVKLQCSDQEVCLKHANHNFFEAVTQRTVSFHYLLSYP